jgi:hemin uptake protein HemP
MSKSPPPASAPSPDQPAPSGPAPLPRINSRDLFRQAREIEIEHEGRIYRLRMTSLNKLILTA